MAYRIQKGNIRKPRRRRQTTRRRSVRRAPIRRRTSRRQTNKKNDCYCPGELSAGAKFALSQLDPFEPRCLGAKIPDSNTMPSLANADTDIVSISSGATAGHLVAAAFSPSYGGAVNVATAGATQVTWAASASQTNRQKYDNFIAAVEAFRPVSHALRLSCPTAPTTTTGFVHLGISVESRYSSSDAVTTTPEYPRTVNEMAGLAHYKRVTLASLTQSPITVINKWIDESGFRYVDPRNRPGFISGVVSPTNLDNYGSFNFQGSWGALIVMIEGSVGTSSTLLSVEHLLLSEALPKKDAFILGTGAAPNSPGTMSAVSTMVSDQDFVHTESQQDSYIQSGMQRLNEGAAIAGERVWNDVAAPLLSRFGNAVVNTGVAMAFNAINGRGGIPGVNSNPARLILS